MLQAGTLQGKTLGKYRIDSLLGDGGQAVVYKAWHKDFESWVALKFLQERIAQKSALRERFKREARLQFKLQHPHIIRVIEIIEEDDLLGMAMDWIEGPDLEHYLAKRGGPLSNEELARIFLPVLSAVGYAHKNNVIHRDLKPSNILLGGSPGEEIPKVMDFGIAKSLEDESHNTKTNSVLGTPHYIAPEQATSTKHVDHRADIYALGITLYQLVSGHLPFEGREMLQILGAHLMESPPPLSAWGVQVDPELEAIVQHSLLKDPAQRFQSCDEFATSLLGYLQKHITSPSGVFLGATSLSPVPSSFSSPATPSFSASAISSNQNSPAAYAPTETRLPTGQHTDLGASSPTIYPDATGRSNKPLLFALLLLVLLPTTGLGLYYSGFFRAPAQSSQTPQKNPDNPSQARPLAPTAQGFALQVRPAPKPPEISQPTAPVPPRTSPAALGQFPKVPPVVEPRTPATSPLPPRSEPRKRKLRSHRRKAPAMSCKRCIKDVFRRHPPTANVFSLHHGCQTKMLQRAAHDCVKACQRTPRRFCRTYGGYLAHQHLRYTYPAKSAEGLWLMATRNILGRCMRRLKQNASLIFSHPYRFPNESTTNQCILAFDKGLRRSLYRWKQKQQAKTKSPLSPPETWKQFKNKMKQSADKFKKDAEKFKRGLGFDD